MAEYGEWNRKGAVLSDVTAQKEYGVTRDFIVKGVQAGELEFREGAVWGNPYLRVLRSQLERYIVAQLGSEYLVSKKSRNELHAIRKEISDIRKKLAALEARKAALECAIKNSGSYAASAKDRNVPMRASEPDDCASVLRSMR
jgi:hypothetical protein